MTIATEATSQGMSVVRRHGAICGLTMPAANTPTWAISSARAIPIDPDATPRSTSESVVMQKALTLMPKEQVLGIFKGQTA